MISTEMIDVIFKAYKEDHNIGPVDFKMSLSGNHEPEQKEIEETLEKESFHHGFIIRNISVLHDDDAEKGFTRVKANLIDKDRLLEYIVQLEDRNTPESHNRLASALNKAIKLLDNYNNMYGDTMNKTTEISELDEILKLNT